MTTQQLPIVDSSVPPPPPTQKVADPHPSLILGAHSLCPGCGEPVALRLLMESLQDLGIVDRSIGVVGHGCYGSFVRIMDIDVLQCLHGRAPAVATGIKRVRPDSVVFTLQGDGDMVTEGLHEIMQTAARGENVTAILLNNGVFGDTGGQATSTTVLGQRTKTSLDGRDPELHGHPIPISEILADMPGVGYIARGQVGDPGGITRTKKMIREALQCQVDGNGFSMVEVLTMCPTGWFVPAEDGPGYQQSSLEKQYPMGVLKKPEAKA